MRTCEVLGRTGPPHVINGRRQCVKVSLTECVVCGFQVNNSTILGASGDYADYQYLKQVIEQMV